MKTVKIASYWPWFQLPVALVNRPGKWPCWMSQRRAAELPNVEYVELEISDAIEFAKTQKFIGVTFKADFLHLLNSESLDKVGQPVIWLDDFNVFDKIYAAISASEALSNCGNSNHGETLSKDERVTA